MARCRCWSKAARRWRTTFHTAGLVDRYVVYLAPALFGGDDARGLFAGAGAPTIADVWRGRIDSVTRLGGDLRVDLLPADDPTSAHPTGRPEPHPTIPGA